MDILNNKHVYEAFSNLFLYHRTQADLPPREQEEKRQLGNKEQAAFAGHQGTIKGNVENQMSLMLQHGYNVLRTTDIIKYYEHCGWMTGLPMDTTNDGKIEGNEWEHVLPFYFQIIFGGGLNNRTRFDLGQDARQNSELLDSLDILNTVIRSDDAYTAEEKIKAEQKKNNILERMAKDVTNSVTVGAKGGIDRFAGLPELNDNLYNDIFTFCRINKKQRFDIAVNRNRLNILCMAKCESYINRCKTNNLFVTFYNGQNLNERKFHYDGYRIRSFMEFVTEPLMTTEDIKEQPFWKDEVWGHDLRIKELPKNASLKSGIVKSPSLKPYIQDIMKGNQELLDISISNTNLVMQTVCSQLNLYMKERVLVNCIYFLTQKGMADAKVSYQKYGASSDLSKKKTHSEHMLFFYEYFMDHLRQKLGQNNGAKQIRDYLNVWLSSKDEFEIPFRKALIYRFEDIQKLNKNYKWSKKTVDAALEEVKRTLMKKDEIEWLARQLNKKRRKEPESPDKLTMHEGVMKTSYQSTLAGQSQPFSPPKKSGEPEVVSSGLFDVNSGNVMKNYIATCFNYLYADERELNSGLRTIEDEGLLGLINSLRVGTGASSSGGRKKKTKRKKTRRKRRRKKKKRTRRKK